MDVRYWKAFRRHMGQPANLSDWALFSLLTLTTLLALIWAFL